MEDELRINPCKLLFLTIIFSRKTFIYKMLSNKSIDMNN